MQALREYPRLLYLGTAGVATALVFPLFGLWLLVCRCCCGACGGTTNRVESRADECWRCICFFSLGACCLFMMVAAGVAIVTELYTYAGISALLPYTKRFIQDMETGYLKTQHEIDTLLLKDYSIFENEMAQRLDNCVKLIEEDMESVLAANPALLAKKLVDRIVLLTADAVPLRDAANQYVAAASALQTRTNFSFGNPAIKDILDQCLSVQPQVNACDPVMQTQAGLQAQTENFTDLAAIEDKIRNYSDVLRLASASLFVPAVNKAVDAKAKDVLMRRAQASVIQAKMHLKVFGDELGDLANAFYIDALEYPEDLLANVDQHFGRPYKVAAGVAIVTELYTYAGISALLPYTKRFIQDMETGYLKTQHEIDTLLLKDYSIFENEMAQRLDNCVKLIEEDMESVLAANPALLAKKLVDRIVLLTADAVPLRDAANQYVAAASALQTRTNFSFGNPAIKDVLDQCLSVQPQVNACDPVMQTQAGLQAQTENFTDLAAIEDKIRNYSDVLRLASASLFVPAVNKAVDAKAKDVLMRRAQASVIQAKMHLKVFGDELGDLANAFYIDALEYPEDLLANVDQHFGRPYKRAEPLLLGYVAHSAALVCLLLLPPMLYFGGLAMVALGTADGHCTYRSGRWCFSLGSCLFVFFGVVALFTTFGLVVTFFAMRCGCAIAADLTNPDVATPLRFLIQLVQLYTKDSSVPSKLATAVSMDHLLGIVMRFGVCPSEPRSAYHLVGESFVRNASRALGLEKELSFLWNGFNYEQLENQIGGIRLAIGSVLNVSEISALATPLESMGQVPLQAMDAREIQSQVEQISSEEENAITLKTALQSLYQELASQPAFQTLVANATTEVDDIISDFTDCQVKKNVLQDALKKLESALEIDSTPIEVFMAETISALKNTKALQDQMDKVAAMIEPYKKNLADVIRGYGDYVVSQMKDTIGNCAPAYAMYESSVNVVCDGIVNPFGAYWLSVASCLAVGTVAMFMALCMSTLYSRKPRPPLPPPEPKPEPHFEPLAQPLLERGSPPPEYAKHVPEPTGYRVRRLVKGERESCIMESTDSGRGRSDSFAHSCSCIFGNTPPLCVLEDEDGNIKNKTSKEKKLGDEGRGSGGRIFRHAQTQTGEANEALEHRDADEVLHVAVKVVDEEGRMKSVEGTQKESTRERANVKNVSGREKGTAEDSWKGLAVRMTEEKKHHDGARLIHPSSTDVRVVLYDPPETRIRSAVRNLWQCYLPFGRRSSLLRSISSTTQSVGTRLFSRYRDIDEFSSRASLE